MSARVFLVGLVAACVIGCHSNPKPQAPAADAREKHSMPDSVHWVRNSAEYEALTIQAYRQAQDVLGRAIGDRKPGTWAVILDADETVVDNSEYQKEREAQGLKFTSESWRQWTLRKDAGAVPGAVAFLRWVKSKGGTVAIVTNRDKVECDDTEDNLKKLGLQYDVALCMDGDREKEPRFERVQQGTAKPGLPPAEVLMWVGDNIGDFPDLTQALHGKPESDYALFGTRYIVMPNPMYGSWERTERK